MKNENLRKTLIAKDKLSCDLQSWWDYKRSISNTNKKDVNAINNKKYKQGDKFKLKNTNKAGICRNGGNG